jgi:hypothetical protein
METLYDLAVVGAGLSALSALRAGLAREGTIVLDYQDTPGGFLCHALPTPGFEDAWQLIQSFRSQQGISTCSGATAVGLLPALRPGEPHTLLTRLREGTIQIRARRVLLACGGLEMTREQAQIPGTRPAGVMTPILVHQLLARGYLPGRRAIVYGDTHYARVTMQRLIDAGMQAILIAPTTSKRTHGQTCAELAEIAGFPRLECVTLRRDDQFFDVPADTLVYAAGMRANTHWLKGSGISTAPDGRIQVDTHYQTSVRGIYAIGTVVAPSLDHTDSIAMGKRAADLLNGGLL